MRESRSPTSLHHTGFRLAPTQRNLVPWGQPNLKHSGPPCHRICLGGPRFRGSLPPQSLTLSWDLVSRRWVPRTRISWPPRWPPQPCRSGPPTLWVTVRPSLLSSRPTTSSRHSSPSRSPLYSRWSGRCSSLTTPRGHSPWGNPHPNRWPGSSVNHRSTSITSSSNT